MKKFSIFLPLFLALFFFLLPNVRAEEITYTIPDNYFDIFSQSYYSTLKDNINNYMSSNNLTNYLIRVDYNSSGQNFR